MDSANPTPSISVKVPANLEHIEAKQAAVNSERLSYVASLSERDQKRFAAIDKAIVLLTEAEVPFWLFADPEQNGRGPWVFQKTTYVEPLTKEWADQTLDNVWSTLKTAIHSLIPGLAVVIPIYNYDQELLCVFGNPPPKEAK